MHAVNVLLHLATAILFFVTLQRLTNEGTKSMIVAISVCDSSFARRSVAWVAERKDVLCGLLIVLTLWCYERYVRQPSRRNYLYVLLAFGLACMAKPMAVIIPVLMITVDYWPLKRIAFRKNCRSLHRRGLGLGCLYRTKAAGALDMAGPLSLDRYG